MVVQLALEEARRVVVRAAMLDAQPGAEGMPHDLVELAGRLGGLRVELTSTVVPAAEHVGYTRLGPRHRAADLDRAIADGRVFERRWRVHPLRDLGLHLAGMRAFGRHAGVDAWVEANEPFRRGILDRIADEGPLTSREIPDEAIVPWPSSGWTDDRNVTQMLDLLHGRGELAVVGRVGRLRVWDLAERVYPADTAEVPDDEARRVRAERLLGALGLVRDGLAVLPEDLRRAEPVGELAEVEGVDGRWRVDPDVLAAVRHEPFAGRTAILSPFDRLVFDRDRLVDLFDFEYVLEMYKPRATRRWGAFALPVLDGDRLVGKIDAKADRRRGVLDVHAVHEDVRFDAALRERVDAELAAFARWTGLAVRR
jgi:uncharacterized protein